MKRRHGMYLLCLVLAAGCQRPEDGADTAWQETEAQTAEASEEEEGLQGWTANGEEEITLDWYINFSWYFNSWGESLVSKVITERTGVSVNMIVPQGSASDRLDSMILSDSLPDLVTLGWWEPQVDEMINKDLVYALNELADRYEPYFWDAANGVIVDWYTRDDGNLYCYPNYAYVPQDYEIKGNISSNQTFLVRKDIYEAIGSPDMTTPEGYHDAVVKAAEMFPEVDGAPLIPVGSHEFSAGCDSFDEFLMNFLAIPFEKDGKIYDRYTDPEYIRWLKMFRQLYEEGYLTDDIFLDRRTQMEEKIARGQYFCMLYQWKDMEAQQRILYQKDPDMIYMAVDGPRNANGDDPVLTGMGTNGWTVTLVSKNCKYPERAIAFISYLLSDEGQKLTYLGIEGETYEETDGVIRFLPEAEHLLNSDQQEFSLRYGCYTGAYWMLLDGMRILQWKPVLEEVNPCSQLEEWTYPYVHYAGQYSFDFKAGTEARSIDTSVKNLWGETLPRLLTAEDEDSFDRILQEFAQRREEMGFEKLQEAKTEQMKAAKQKLGLE